MNPKLTTTSNRQLNRSGDILKTDGKNTFRSIAPTIRTESPAGTLRQTGVNRHKANRSGKLSTSSLNIVVSQSVELQP